MDAMTMPFEVRQATDLRDIVPGAVVEFTLVVGDTTSYATRVSVRRYQTVGAGSPHRAPALGDEADGRSDDDVPCGDWRAVPDFSLIDQTRQRVTLSALSGKVVAVNFVYTRCALPQFCLRMSNNFGALQKRFARELGRELVLLTITFDPERDTPEALASYASRWQANPAGWHFLTGSPADIRRVCGFFGQEAFADEGLMNHSLHTVGHRPHRHAGGEHRRQSVHAGAARRSRCRHASTIVRSFEKSALIVDSRMSARYIRLPPVLPDTPETNASSR